VFLLLGPGETGDLAGEISYNSDHPQMLPTDFHKKMLWRGVKEIKDIG
jgi:hypothetical protein